MAKPTPKSVSKSIVKRDSSPPKRTVFHLREDRLDAGFLGEDSEAEGILRSQLGEEYYKQMRELAQRAKAAHEAGIKTRGKRKAAQERVIVLPGIMGSELGRDRKLLPFLTNLIWLDPLDTMLGNIEDLKFDPDTLKPKDKSIRALGPFPIVYYGLRKTIEAAGFEVETIGFDWRQRLDVLGEFLAEQIKARKEPTIHIVAHSMGGLVTRAMLKLLKDAGDTATRNRIKRIITVATPHGGSLQAIKALRGTHDMANLVSNIDFTNSRVELTESTFSTLPGLYHLLPREVDGFEVFNEAAWPNSSALRPRSKLLSFAQTTPSLLGDTRGFTTIIGVDKDTAVDARVEGGRFIYQVSTNGDGTVPRKLAEMDTSESSRRYAAGSHMTLPMQDNVQQAVVSLLKTGDCSLPREHPVSSVLKPEPEEVATRGTRSARATRQIPTDDQIRAMLSPLLGGTEMQTVRKAAPAPTKHTGITHPLTGVVFGRRKQRQIDIELFLGDLTHCPARAYALGTWAGVAPGGAASAVDALMEGAITDMFQRRFFGGQVGEIFTLPTGRWPVRTDLLLFAGMGPFDRFQMDTLEVIGENIIRTFVKCNVEEFAMVPLGGSSTTADDMGSTIERLARGILRGLVDADQQGHFRRIIICERDPQMFAIIKEQLVRLAISDLCEDVELCVRDLPPDTAPSVSRALPSAAPSRPTAYLIARQVDADPSIAAADTTVETSLLLPAGKGAVLTGRVVRSSREIDDLLEVTSSEDFDSQSLSKLGAGIAAKLIHPDVTEALSQLGKMPADQRPELIVLHDAIASRLPWESLAVSGWTPALDTGLIRRHLAENLSVAKWLDQRQRTKDLHVLLVVDPTSDLAGARAEGHFLRTFLQTQRGIQITVRMQGEATRERLLEDFKSGSYDVVHYAGHGAFFPEHPGRSGLLCAGKKMLTGTDLSALGQLPMLVFFNACEVGRIRGLNTPAARVSHRNGARKRNTDNVGVAEALLRGGVANYLGTYWPVGDDAAETFAKTFYPAVLNGSSLGVAVQQARHAVQKLGSIDWADYLFYGDPDFKLTP